MLPTFHFCKCPKRAFASWVTRCAKTIGWCDLMPFHAATFSRAAFSAVTAKNLRLCFTAISTAFESKGERVQPATDLPVVTHSRHLLG
jgi:hypothetical protein